MESTGWIPPKLRNNPLAWFVAILISACGFLAAQWTTAEDKRQRCAETNAQIERACSDRLEAVYKTQIAAMADIQNLKIKYEELQAKYEQLKKRNK